MTGYETRASLWRRTGLIGLLILTISGLAGCDMGKIGALRLPDERDKAGQSHEEPVGTERDSQ